MDRQARSVSAGREPSLHRLLLLKVSSHLSRTQSPFERLIEDAVTHLRDTGLFTKASLRVVFPDHRTTQFGFDETLSGQKADKALVRAHIVYKQIEVVFEGVRNGNHSDRTDEELAQFIAQQVGIAAERDRLLLANAALREESLQIGEMVKSRKQMDHAYSLLRRHRGMSSAEASKFITEASQQHGKTVSATVDSIVTAFANPQLGFQSPRHRTQPNGRRHRGSRGGGQREWQNRF